MTRKGLATTITGTSLSRGCEFFAKGLFGQYLYVNRDTDTVIARFGVEQGPTDWIETFREISGLLGAQLTVQN